jgi:hypothetical protein
MLKTEAVLPNQYWCCVYYVTGCHKGTKVRDSEWHGSSEGGRERLGNSMGLKKLLSPV